ncbi:MAG: hypothetical protein C4293_20795, partial [Nitrospiraceae bacterium]
MYVVREFLTQKLGTLREPSWADGVLKFWYEGRDGLYRGLFIHFSQVPDKTDGTTAHFVFTLAPREVKQLRVSLLIQESSTQIAVQPATLLPHADVFQLEAKLQGASEKWLDTVTDVFSDSMVLEEAIDRSFRDLQVLRMKMEQETFFAAGTPWFATLFGRDSLLTALQILAY